MLCGTREAAPDSEFCTFCAQEIDEDTAAIEKHEADGHTHHCACAMVWGGMPCECGKKGYIPGRVSRIIEYIRYMVAKVSGEYPY
jgi:hypothetical protein